MVNMVKCFQLLDETMMVFYLGGGGWESCLEVGGGWEKILQEPACPALLLG